MITIGIRAAPGAVTFAVIDTDDNSVINVEKIKIPAAFETPDALKYVRSNLLDILREYQVERAGIRVTEAIADGSAKRIQLEGVALREAFASSVSMRRRPPAGWFVQLTAKPRRTFRSSASSSQRALGGVFR